ncbi:hypothetical protein RKD24_005031 [Streptomyces calvus]
MAQDECLLGGEEEVGRVGRVRPSVGDEAGDAPDGVGDT